uniref:Uncharacterized protein n=1 Tax=Talaromyces marneffei PM1 TaxID=1077442 RepID=A0A093XIK3_TALMA
MGATTYVPIEPRKLRYTGDAMTAFKVVRGTEKKIHNCPHCTISGSHFCNLWDNMEGKRVWVVKEKANKPPVDVAAGQHTGGRYALTSALSPRIRIVMQKHRPNESVLDAVTTFSTDFHAAVNEERKQSSGLHDIDLIEDTYQIALEVGAEILMAADTTETPIDIQPEFHSSRAGSDDHLSSWGRLLTALECDPPIIALLSIYLMFCQSFTFEPNPTQADYVYAALTAVDWVKGNNEYSKRVEKFIKLAHAAVPSLDDVKSGQDRSFWRISHQYLIAINEFENSRPFKAPRKAHIDHNVKPELVIAMRALDTIGSAYMRCDGAAWLDDAGMDALIGSALPNDAMDLHTDILTGETRNTIRLIYPDGLTMDQAMKTMSTYFSGQLCELFRDHERARFGRREDGRIAASSAPYSLCRARHRRVFEIMELYINKYGDQFWEWTWEILRMAKEQVTEAGLKEPLFCALLRSARQDDLPESPISKFFDAYYEMIEDGSAQMQKTTPLGVSKDLAEVTRKIHTLWHGELLRDMKEPGWGRRFDAESDRLFGEAATILEKNGNVDVNVNAF